MSKQNRRSRRLNVETLCRRDLMAGDMTNPANHLDVNNDNSVSALDAVVIINHMSRVNASAEGEGLASDSSGSTRFFPDTNGDSKVTASDALQVINAMSEEEVTTQEIDSSSNLLNQVSSLRFTGGSSPAVTFTADNLEVTVTSPQSGVLELRDANGVLVETIAIRQDFRINATGNNNLITFAGAIIPDDLIINFEGNNNGVRLLNTQIGDDFLYTGSNGVDGVLIDAGTRIAEDVIIKLRGGADQVGVRNAQIGDDFLLYAEDGVDTLIATGVSIGDDAIVRMGDDNDVVSIQNVDVRDVADVEGDSGIDSLAADDVIARRLRPSEFEVEGTILNINDFLDD